MVDQEINELVARKLGDCLVGCKHIPLPYCTQMAAAWKVVEKSTMYRLQYFERVDKDPDCHSATLRIDGEIYMAFGSSCAMAICLAFLKLDQAPAK